MAARIAGLKAVLVAALVVAASTNADARGTQRKGRGYKTVELAMIRGNPKAFIGKRVAFDCFFAGLGRIYQPFQTPFVAEQFLNFYVWEPGTKLWDNKERRKAFLFCYIPREMEKQADYIMSRKMYESVRILGRVTVVYAEHPWFEVEDVESSAMPGVPEASLNHILVGIKSITNDDFEMAQESFEQALKAGLPRSAQDFAQRELGKACYELGKYVQAERALRTAAQVSPNDPWILLKRGQSLSRAADESKNAKLKTRMLKEALGYLDRARQLAPAEPDCHSETGWVRAKLGARGDGIRDVKRAIALKSTAPSFRILGRIYIDMNKLAAAENAYHNAIVRDYSNPLYHREVADLIHVRQGRYSDAEGEYGNLIQLTSTEPDGYILRAGVLLKLGKIDEALKDYAQALRHDPENLDALLGRAAVHISREDYDRAQGDLGQATRLAPKDVKVLVAGAELRRAQGSYDDAVDAYRRILREKALRGSLAQVHYGLGVCLAKKPKPELKSAAAELQRAVTGESGNVEYIKALATVQMDLGQFAPAVKKLQEVKKLMPTDERSRLYLAQAMAEAGNLKGAIVELEELIRDVPGSLYARNNLAYLLLEQGRESDFSRAEKLAQYAYNKQQANPVFQDTFAWALFNNNEVEKARNLLELAVMKSKQAEPFYHLADVANAQGETELARTNVEDALRILNAITRPGAVTRRLLTKALSLARKVGASTRPGPKE